jgi:hypothetical protein
MDVLLTTSTAYLILDVPLVTLIATIMEIIILDVILMIPIVAMVTQSLGVIQVILVVTMVVLRLGVVKVIQAV